MLPGRLALAIHFPLPFSSLSGSHTFVEIYVSSAFHGSGLTIHDQPRPSIWAISIKSLSHLTMTDLFAFTADLRSMVSSGTLK